MATTISGFVDVVHGYYNIRVNGCCAWLLQYQGSRMLCMATTISGLMDVVHGYYNIRVHGCCAYNIRVMRNQVLKLTILIFIQLTVKFHLLYIVLSSANKDKYIGLQPFKHIPM